MSNLEFISKLVECAMMQQLNDHIAINELDNPVQSAYKKYHSCETSLTKFVNDLLWSMENSSLNALVATDLKLSAAFDTVDHQVLVSVLENKFGIKDTALRWFRSFLHDRQFKVSVRGTTSEVRTFNYSVAQGSCSGPLLFCLYSSTLSSILSPSITLSAFADDHTLNKSYKPEMTCETDTRYLLEHSLIQIDNWMKENRLKMNTSKTEFIVFDSPVQLTKCKLDNLQVVNDEVPKTRLIRLLGAWLDKNLNFNTHATKKCRSAMWTLMKIRQIRKYLDQDSTKLLVDTLATSHIDYCNALLFGACDYVIRKFERVQNAAAKLILQLQRQDSATEALRQLHWLPIRARIDFKIALMVYKCLNNMGPSYLKGKGLLKCAHFI